jgi:hypothetical protein
MWVYLFYIEFCGASHIEGLIPLNAGIMGGRVSLNRQSSTGIASAQERHLAQSHNPFLDSPYPMNSYKILKKSITISRLLMALAKAFLESMTDYLLSLPNPASFPFDLKETVCCKHPAF